MHNRKSNWMNKSKISIQQTYLTTLSSLKTLSKHLPNVEDKKNCLDASELLTKVSENKFTDNIIESHQTIKNVLITCLLHFPEDHQEYHAARLQLENGLLLLEQSSSSQRQCLITNESISFASNALVFISINQCSLSYNGFMQLMKARSKYEDSDDGLRAALKEITPVSHRNKVDDMSVRDIFRLRLLIESNTYFGPSYYGLILGSIFGALAPVLVLSFVTTSLPSIMMGAVLSTLFSMLAGNQIQKAMVKKQLSSVIGPVPVFQVGSSLHQLLSDEQEKKGRWCNFFYCCFPRKVAECALPHASPSRR